MAGMSILQTTPTYDDLHKQGYTDAQIARELERARSEQGLASTTKPLTVWNIALGVLLGNLGLAILGAIVYAMVR